MTLLLDAALSKRDLSSANIRPLADKIVAYYTDKLSFLQAEMYDYVFIPFAVLLWEALVYVHSAWSPPAATVCGDGCLHLTLNALVPLSGLSCGTASSSPINAATRWFEASPTCVHGSVAGAFGVRCCAPCHVR